MERFTPPEVANAAMAPDARKPLVEVVDNQVEIEETPEEKQERESCEIIINAYSQTERSHEEDLADLHGEAVVQEDVAQVKKQKKSFEIMGRRNFGGQKNAERMKRRADAIEALNAHHGELSNWYGQFCFVIRTAEYDDFNNGVDSVIEFDIPDPKALGVSEKVHRIALAIDVTTSQNKPLRHKLERCIERATNPKKMKKLKYFQSQVEPEVRGELEVIPVVIALEKENATDLINLVAKLIQFDARTDLTPEELAEKREIKAQVENHPVSVLFLQEIRSQLVTYLDILGSKKSLPDKKRLTGQIHGLIQVIGSVLDERKAMVDPKFKDKSLNRIQDFCKERRRLVKAA